MTTHCPFCAIAPDRIIWQTDLVFAILDGFPVSPGHTLIIPKRHVPSLFDATGDERHELMAGIDWAKHYLDAEYKPDSYNIGINDGPAAGQTVPHLHIHLIPRYNGDREDPRGGVRWVIPDKAKYWGDDS
jgi:diadenosine tetraphosphate (Ap4A) HIT family hydrolase